VLRAVAVDGDHVDVVEVFDEHPAAGRQRRHQPVEHLETLGEVEQIVLVWRRRASRASSKCCYTGDPPARHRDQGVLD
jgi:hypothetical protein